MRHAPIHDTRTPGYCRAPCLICYIITTAISLGEVYDGNGLVGRRQCWRIFSSFLLLDSRIFSRRRDAEGRRHHKADSRACHGGDGRRRNADSARRWRRLAAHVQLRPSTARAINEADVFIRISDTLEPFTRKIVQALPASVTVVTLAACAGHYPSRSAARRDVRTSHAFAWRGTRRHRSR